MSTKSPTAGTIADGAAWMIAARIAERVLGFGSTIILARLLAPSDFGLVAMAMVFVAAADLLGAFGLDWALVRQPGLETRHLDTAWTIRAVFGVITLGVLALVALPAADFYREPRISAMIFVLGFSLLIAALENPGVIMFRREMNFSKEFQLRTTAKVCGAVVAISVAVASRSYWALLLGILASRVTACIMSYALHPHRPRPTLAARSELLGFSTWLWISNILTFMRTRIVEMILGRMTGPRSLGLFTVAGELAQLASSELAAPIHRVLFSAYAANSSRPMSIGEIYLKAAPIIWAIALPLVVGMYLTAPQVVLLFLGAQWGEAVPLLRILAIAGAAGLLSTGAIHVYWAIDRARLETAVEVCWVACLVGLVLILTPRQGLVGAAQAVLVSSLMVLPINVFLLRRFAGVSVWRTVARCWRTILACGVMAAVALQLDTHGPVSDAPTALRQLLSVAVVGGVTYVVALFGIWRLVGRPEGPEHDILSLIRSRLVWRARRP